MPFEDLWLRKDQPSPIEWERRMYEETQNLLHVFRAYQICRELMQPPGRICDTLPGWIFDYFDNLAEAVKDEFHEDKPSPAKLLEAMQVKAAGQGVRTTAFSDFVLAQRDMWLAIEVRRGLRDKPGRSIEDACACVEERLAERTLQLLSPEPPVKQDTIRNAFTHWNAFLEERARLWK